MAPSAAHPGELAEQLEALNMSAAELGRQLTVHASRIAEIKAKQQRPPQRIARHRTGRNQQINIKATTETIERFYKLADERRVALGELLEHALNALEKSVGRER
jgi:hypothetical protein